MGGSNMPAATRGSVAGHFAVELDGLNAGMVRSASGGGAVGAVITGTPGPDHHQHKHIGAVKYQDILLTFGTGMSKSFYQWVASVGEGHRKSGALIVCDYNL